MTPKERTQDAQRLSDLTGRKVEYRSTPCGCDYWKYCPQCAGDGSFWIPVYASCGHHLLDDDRDEACYANYCKEREKVAETFPVEHPILRSLTEAQEEREVA